MVACLYVDMERCSPCSNWGKKSTYNIMNLLSFSLKGCKQKCLYFLSLDGDNIQFFSSFLCTYIF